MSPRLFIEGDLRPERLPGYLDALHRFPHVGWLVQVDLVGWNTRVRDDNWSAWGSLRAAEYLASRPKATRGLKPMWWDSGFGLLPEGEDTDASHTTSRKAIQAGIDASFDTSTVWPLFKGLFSDVRDAGALPGLGVYFEWERIPFFDPGVLRGILNDPRGLRNLTSIGGTVAGATIEDWIRAVNFDDNSERAAALRQCVGRFQNVLASAAAWSMLRQFTRRWTQGWWCLSNTAMTGLVDNNGHVGPPIRADQFQPGQLPCLYMQTADDFKPPAGPKVGQPAEWFNDRASLEHAAAGKQLVPNVSGHLPGEVIARRARLNATCGAPTIVFAGDGDRALSCLPNILEAARLTAPND